MKNSSALLVVVGCKRNPVDSAVVLAEALRVPALVSTMLTAMTQEHQRGIGG